MPSIPCWQRSSASCARNDTSHGPTDDEDGLTSLSGVDLYPDVWQHVAAVRNLGGHPYEFYQKCGYVIVGVVPDANGPGKPDILMAKRVSSSHH